MAKADSTPATDLTYPPKEEWTDSASNNHNLVDDVTWGIIREKWLIADMALSGLHAQSKESLIEPMHIEAVHSTVSDLWEEVRNILRTLRSLNC